MKKKLFVIIVLAILLMIFIIPKGKEESVKIKKKDYNTFNLKTGVEYLIEKANSSSISNYNDGNKGEMYTFSHDATEQTPAQTDYRYIGDNPNNYVYFNCDDASNKPESTCELWRIIGVFDVDDGTGNIEQRIKIIRNDSFANTMAYDEGNNNYWVTSSLNEYLNEQYFNSLSTVSKQMVGNSKYYLGTEEISSYVNGTPDDIYSWERGNKAFSNEREYYNNNIMGLMYPSDYAYTFAYGVDDICYNNISDCGYRNIDGQIVNQEKSWFTVKDLNTYDSYPTQLLISSTLNNESNTIVLLNIGKLCAAGGCSSYGASFSYAVRPVTYLKSDVYIYGGNGTKKKPYKLSLNNSDVDTEQYKNYKSYVFGEKVVYDNNNYYVIEDSDSDTRYVSLLKEELLTAQEVNEYSSNYSSINGEYPYLENNNCNSSVQANCSTNYKDSNVKLIIDNWASQYNNDLVIVNGLKARLLTEDIFKTKLGFENYYDSPHTYYRVGEHTLDWAYFNGKSYWAMSQYGDSSSVFVIGNNVIPEKVYNKLYIRPVIYLNKCAIEGGCLYDEEYVRTDDVNDIDDIDDIDGDDKSMIGKVIVTVANTLKHLPQIILFISVIFIIIGLSIFGYNYYKSRKERK